MRGHLSSPPEKTFWVTNMSNRNVSLSDLYISIPAQSSVNLLDSRHYHFTEDQLQTSAAQGSLFRKQHLLAIRKVPPQMIPMAQIMTDPNVVMPSHSTSIYEIKQQIYEELNIGEESLVMDASSNNYAKGK